LINPDPASIIPPDKSFHTWISNIGNLAASEFRLHPVLLGRFYSSVSETSALRSCQGVAANGGLSLDRGARVSRVGFLRHTPPPAAGCAWDRVCETLLGRVPKSVVLRGGGGMLLLPGFFSTPSQQSELLDFCGGLHQLPMLTCLST
jgi:hypothetical protein